MKSPASNTNQTLSLTHLEHQPAIATLHHSHHTKQQIKLPALTQLQQQQHDEMSGVTVSSSHSQATNQKTSNILHSDQKQYAKKPHKTSTSSQEPEL
jgi:hypothetical protein